MISSVEVPASLVPVLTGHRLNDPSQALLFGKKSIDYSGIHSTLSQVKFIADWSPLTTSILFLHWRTFLGWFVSVDKQVTLERIAEGYFRSCIQHLIKCILASTPQAELSDISLFANQLIGIVRVRNARGGSSIGIEYHAFRASVSPDSIEELVFNAISVKWDRRDEVSQQVADMMEESMEASRAGRARRGSIGSGITKGFEVGAAPIEFKIISDPLALIIKHSFNSCESSTTIPHFSLSNKPPCDDMLQFLRRKEGELHLQRKLYTFYSQPDDILLFKLNKLMTERVTRTFIG